MSEERLTLKRRYATARSRVFDAWTRPPDLRRWAFIRPGKAAKSVRVDLYAGGTLELVLLSRPDRERRWGTFREIHAPDRLRFTWTANGLGLDGRPTRVTVNIDGGDTESTLTLVHEGFPDAASMEANREAWEELLEALKGFLESSDPG